MGNFFGNLNDKFQSFMIGRNGPDRLSRWSLGAACILIVVNAFAPNPILMAISYALLFYSIYRMFSSNVAARQAENAKFDRLLERISPGGRAKTGGSSGKGSPSGSPTSASQKATGSKATAKKTSRDAKVRFTCDSCGQSLSVPKGRGKLKVTCPKCHHQMTIDS